MKSLSPRLILFYILVSISLFGFSSVVAQDNLLYVLCDPKGNFTANSVYATNLNKVLAALYTNTSVTDGFYRSTYGDTPDKVYAVAQCRPDMDSASCRVCIRELSQKLTKNCTNYKEAMGGYNEEPYTYCMLRYTNWNFDEMEVAPYFYVHSLQSITTDVAEFKQARISLLDRLQVTASKGDFSNKSAYGSEPYSSTVLYAYVQCTPDLSQSECNYCLQNATGSLSKCCDLFSGGRVIYPSCNFRYEMNPIYKVQYDPDSQLSPPVVIDPPPSPPPPGKKLFRIVIIIVCVLVGTAALLIICICIYLRLRKRKDEVIEIEEIKDVKSLQFEFNTIRDATNNFSDANKLGQGGFGIVYKGVLPFGQEVAVKRLIANSIRGDQEFKNEVSLIAGLQHRNLVRLFGFCLEKNEKLLVLEFVPNSSLNNFIFDPIKREEMDWQIRHKIITGIARGLLYLHEDSRLRIIHRDLKAGNILLDSEMNPKITDFGIARLFPANQIQESTENRVGTFGYMAPEYLARGHFSSNSDVFSYGVLVLEIISGQKRSSFCIGELEEDLLSYAWKNWNQETVLNLIDPCLRGSSCRNEIVRCVQIASLCVQQNAIERPNMSLVVSMLTNQNLPLPDPAMPGFFTESTSTTSTSSATLSKVSKRDISVEEPNDDVTITVLLPR